MLAMHHYLKESGRQAVGWGGIDKNRFCTKSRLCMSSKDLMYISVTEGHRSKGNFFSNSKDIVYIHIFNLIMTSIMAVIKE